jgi:HlyD family secretion protein
MRLNPTNVQNVVTYNVVINVDNPEQKLKPGMTANLTITIDERNNVLKVPNSALRFTPTDANGQRISGGGGNGQGQGRQQNANAQQPAAGASPTSSPSGPSGPLGNGQQGGQRNFALASAPVLEGQTRAIWVLDAKGQPQARRIKIGLTDGASTEVVEGTLQEGEMVIIGQTITSASKPSASPAPGFGGAPRTPGGGGGGTGGRRN